MADFSHLIYGYHKKVPTANGLKRYINFDNAASTPPFNSVMKIINEEAEWYSSVHRGVGYKSKYSTFKYEEARSTVAQFVGADPEHDTVIFTKNTTDSINKISHYLSVLPGEVVVFTRLEHHSNELPWLKGKYWRVDLKNEELDLERLEDILLSNQGKIKLLAVSGASNVTGYTPPIYILAKLAHQAGAKILVDGAQLIPHRPVTMFPASDPRHIDFLAFSGHKMYAPFGVGVLIGPRSVFQHPPPSQLGGGTIKGIGPAGIMWADPPEVEEAGSPNVLGALALAQACRTILEIGWQNLIQHEQELLHLTLKKLITLPGVTIYGPTKAGRVGVVGFNLAGFPHQQVADFLASTEGIGVRSGCFCARSYIQQLLNLSPFELNFVQQHLGVDSSQATPGMVRISFGCYNSLAEIDLLYKTLTKMF